MGYKEFVRTVAERAVLSREEAADVTRATLEKLGERLSQGEAHHLAAQLPDSLRESVRIEGRGEQFGLHDLVMGVSRRTGLTEQEATNGVRAVLTTLRETLTDEVFDHVMSQLPGEFQEMATSPT
ncbi:DUF2267 domain-containing protein [Streptosporangium sp. NPDC000396]|uniref:DUF2267 domain-containing protein n=1 Tax=Streptosporangium sp. NPDC000396 TaxID=3366185 RepID=UPI0036AFC431